MKFDDIEAAFASKGTPLLWLSPECSFFSGRRRRMRWLRRSLFAAVLIEVLP